MHRITPQFSCRLFSFLLLWCIPAGVALAQNVQYATVTGTVSNEAGTPLEGAHVFIAVSMKGTVSGADGRYTLDQVPLGAHRLYVSMLGYEPEARDVVLRVSGEQTFNFILKPTVLQGPEVTVTGEQDKRWRKRLEKFIDLFIGETPNAALTTIVNPEVLDFEEKLGHFSARASAPLVIENRALGYRVQYFLKELVAETNRTKYDGEPLYEEMEPDSPEQAAIWEANRKAAWYGSFRHFILAALAGQVEEQGFKIYSRPANGGSMAQGIFGRLPAQANRGGGGPRFPIKEEEMYSDGQSELEKTLDFHGYVEIIYMGETEDPAYLNWNRRLVGSEPKFQTSWIQLEKGPTTVDYKGDVADPYGVTFSGYLAFERIADELPKEYRPE